MPGETKTQRFIYPTQGVCPPEIHFKVNNGRLEEIRFVGGGCPGNAQLVARLLEGKPLAEALEYLVGIDCRNGTSCPDQLAAAVTALRAEVDHPICRLDHVQIVLDHDDRVSRVDESIENSEKLSNVLKM